MGFRVHYFRDLANPGTTDLRTIRITDAIPFGTQPNCPGCDKELKPFCTLIASDDRKRMRMGLCVSCGYIGYIDRPTKEWIVDYYIEDWDNAKARNLAEEARKLKHGLTAEQRDAVHLADTLSINKEKWVCDIGCGNGGCLKEFQNIGFNHLVVVENSRYRAELAHLKYGFPVEVGNFESPSVAAALKKSAPIGVFFSHHTLEHVYTPREKFETTSGLQEEGDYTILTMPDVVHEPGIITLFWLPHLHGYTRVTLERLLNNHGYEVAADNFQYKRLMMASKKVADPKPRYASDPHAMEAALERIRNWFFVGSMEPGKRYCMWWRSKTYHTGLKPVYAWAAADHMQKKLEYIYDYAAARMFHSFRNQRSIVISPLEKRYTNPADCPLEIQFDGDIELLVR